MSQVSSRPGLAAREELTVAVDGGGDAGGDYLVSGVGKTRRLVIVEEHVHTAGWGAAVISELTAGIVLDAPLRGGWAFRTISYCQEPADTIVPNPEAIVDTAMRLRS
jgi:pyruvate/2-oxoglutarate/acetoin dehydrogenase E1 component